MIQPGMVAGKKNQATGIQAGMVAAQGGTQHQKYLANKKKKELLNSTIKELLPPKNANSKAAVEYVNKYVAGQTLQKIKNDEYVTPAQIDSAVEYFKGQQNTGWAAMNNPSFANINGDKISTQLSVKKDYYSFFKNEDDYKKNKTNVDNQIKYYNYNFKELRDARLKLEEERDNTKDQKKKKSLQKEIDWLENYSVTKEYDTVTDYENAIKSIKSEIGWYENDLAWRRKEGTADEVEEKYSKKIKQLEGQIEVLETGINKASRKKYLYDNYYHLPEEEDFERRVNDINRIQRDISLKRAGIATPKSTDYSMSYLLKNNKINNEKSGIVSSYDYLNIPEDMKNLWLQTTTEEKNICAYLYSGKGGRKAVLDFLEEIKPELSQRDEEWWLKRHINEYVNGDTWQKVKMNLYSIPQSVFGNISAGAEDIISLVKTGNVNPYSSGHRLQNIASTTRQLTSNEIDESIDSDFLSELAVSSYQGVMSAGDMALGGLLLGESGYITSMGLGAFSSKARSLYERGADTSEILLGATLSAVLEVGTEKIGVDRFMKTLGSKTGKEWIKKILVQFGAEPSEELVSKIGNLVIDDLVMGQNSEMQNKIREYISQGMSKDEATKKANTEFVKETFWEMYSALISVGGTGLVSGSFYGIKKVQTQRAINQTAKGIVSKNNVDVLLDLSKTLPANSKVYKFAKSFTEADKKSTSKVSRLYSNFITDINGQIEAKTKNAISARLTELGGVRNANKTSDIIYRMARMEENVEEYEKRSVLKNESANTVYAELTSEKSKTAEWVQNLANDTQQLSEIRNVVAISGNVTNQTLNTVINQLQVSSNSQKSTLQSGAESGIINQETSGGAENELYQKGRMGQGDRENSEFSTEDTRRTSESQRITAEDSVSFQRRIESVFGETRRTVSQNGTTLAFIPKNADNTEGGKAYNILKNNGYNVVYCEGTIYRNDGNVTTVSNEALTTPDGTVYVSSNATLTGVELALHESVHIAQNTSSEAFTDYESVLCENIDTSGDHYYHIAGLINTNNFGGKYDINDINSWAPIMKELSAYINQYVMTDTMYAEKLFGGMFSDWNAVVEAVKKFNNDIGLDLTKATSDNGAASFLPENDSNLSDSDAEKLALQLGVKDILPSNSDKERHHTTKAEQDYIEKICKALGRKVVFEHITAEKLKEIGEDTDGEIPDGYIDKKGIIHIGFVVSDPINFIFKHELTHFGEGTVEYERFVKAVRGSSEYRKWLAEATNNKVNTDLEVLEAAYLENIRNGKGDMSEVYADFVGDRLFKDNGSGLEALVSSIEKSDRPAFIQYILDFLAYLKKKLAGDTNITFEISHLEDSFNRMLSEATRADENGTRKQSKVKNTFARSFDTEAISKAEDMEREGESEKAIWEEQGLIRDNGGVWVYEITDDEIEFFPDGDALVKDDPDYKEFLKLDSKNIWSDKDAERYAELDDKLLIKYDYGIPRLKSFITHNELFQKYPQLKEVELQFADLTRENMLGCYIHSMNKIVLDESLLKNDDNNYELKSVLIHEIQHAIQHIDNREEGSNVEFWNARLLNGKRMPKNPKTNEDYSPEEAYYFTAGEIESRETQRRFDFSADARRYGYVPNFKRDMAIKISEYLNDTVTVPSNSEYSQAVKNNDTKTLQQMVDTAAMANGYTERLYHQTDADFTEFNTDNQRAGKYDFELPAGTFLKPSNEDIGLKGKKQMELYAKLQNPLEFRDREDARSFWEKNVKGYAKAVEEISRIDEEYRAKTDEAMNDVRNFSKEWKQNHPESNSRELYANAEYQRLMDIQDSIVDEWEEESNEASLKAKELINGFISQNDYDGIVVENDEDGANKSTKTYIVFDSNQLKSAEAVTYDDSGEVVPLSERFQNDKKDIRYSFPRNKSNNVIDLSEDNELSKQIGNVTGAEKYKIIQNYILDALKDQPIKLSDGKLAIVDKRDALHIANKSANKKTAQISQLKQLIEKAELFAEDTSVSHNKFDYFCYYKADVKYKGEILPIYLNVGIIKNVQEYHIYDITNKIRDTAHRINGVERPKPNEGYALQTVSPYNSISNNTENVNNKYSFPTEGRKLFRMYENGEISKEEYHYRIEELYQKSLSEMEDRAMAERIEAARYGSRLKRRIKQQNEQLARRRSEISQEISAQREERATKQKNIEHIRKTVSRIDKMFRTNSATKHIPEDLKEASGIFVKIFVDNDVSPFDKRDLREIRTLYGDLIGDYNVLTGEGETAVSGFDPQVIGNLKTLENRLNGKTLRDLNYYETLLIRDIVDNFWQIIKYENKMFVAGKEYEVDQIGTQALKELEAQKTKRENGLIKALDSFIKYGNMTPVYFFDRIGGAFKSLFDDIVVAQEKWYRNAENAKTYIRQMKERFNYDKWSNDTFEFTTEKGDTIEVSREQAMLLYATAKREYGNEYQRAEHLFRGGVVIPPSKTTLKGILKDFKSSNKKGVSKITDAMTKEIESRSHRILPQDVLKVFDWLTKEQRDYADAMVDYLSKDMAALGNETSMQLYGIRKYNEDYYIPYNSAQNYLYSQPGVSNEVRLKHQSFTKETVHGAKNPLILSDFSEVCADHINRMCMYNALTIPLENMNKIFNYSTPSTADKDSRDVKVEIERVYGKSAVEYIKRFLLDMNGDVRTSDTDKALNRWISRFKKGAVFASASVVVQQPSAIMRAMAYINPKYFTKTLFSKRDYQEAVRYAAVAGIKEMGRFDTGTGIATTKWLLQQNPKGLKGKVKALTDLKDSSYRDDKLSYFAAKADEITWAHIWAAVKAEVADKTDLNTNSEEFLKVCGARFTYVINHTQVYDSTISRSQLMRDKSSSAQMLTAFMSEPTLSLNMVMEATHQAKTGGKKGAKFAAGAVAALVGNVILNTALKSLVTAARDDDEEKTYGEKYKSAFTDNLLSDILLLNYIPFIKDVISVFKGYDVERADMSLFSDLVQAIQSLDSETKSTYRKLEDFAGALAAFLGLPVKNVMRDVRSAHNAYNDIFVNDKTDRAISNEAEGYINKLADNKTFKSLSDEEQEELKEKITDTVRDIHEAKENKKQYDEFDKLYEVLRGSGNRSDEYKKLKQKMLDKGLKPEEISEGLNIARIAYMKTQGVDVNEYLLYKIAVSEKHADKDNSGGVNKAEKESAIKKADLSNKSKQYFLNDYK